MLSKRSGKCSYYMEVENVPIIMFIVVLICFYALLFSLKITKEKNLGDGGNHRTPHYWCLQLSGRDKHGKLVLDNL